MSRFLIGISLSFSFSFSFSEQVSKEKRGTLVDSKCKSLTAPWVREQSKENDQVPLCEFFENLESADSTDTMPSGVYTLEDLKEFSSQKKFCPYFLARRMVSEFAKG